MAGKIRAGIFVLGMVLAFYWMFTYSGPYRYLAELQLHRFGSYSPKLTMIGICLLFILAGEAVKILLRGAERPVPGVVTSARLETKVVQYAGFIIPVVCCVMGMYFFLTGLSAGSLREVQMAEITDGTLPPHTIFAEVHGYLDRKYLSQNNYLYIPIREGAESTKPTLMLVGVDDGKMRTEISHQEDGSVTVRGMLEPRLDSEVRYAFDKNGIALANPCWVSARVAHSGYRQNRRRNPDACGDDLRRCVGIAAVATNVEAGAATHAAECKCHETIGCTRRATAQEGIRKTKERG